MTASTGRVPMGKAHPKEMAQFQVYQNLNFVSDLSFEKGRITIGSSRKADLFLDDRSVAGIHALVELNNGKAILTNRFPENGLRLNGEPVFKARLQPEDLIAVGPFALKIKKAGNDNPHPDGDASYFVRLVNQYNSQKEREAAAVSLSLLLNLDLEKTKSLTERDHFIVKKGISCLEAARIQNTMLNAGVICVVQLEESQQQLPIQLVPHSEPVEQSKSVWPEEISTAKPVEDEEQEKTLEVLLVEEYDEEESEEDLWEAPFSMENELGPSHFSTETQTAEESKSISWRHWALSLGIHLAFILFFWVYTAIQPAAPIKQTLHFVKIDRSMLKKAEPPKPKSIPKKKPAPKVEPKKAAEKPKTQKPKPVRKSKAPASRVTKGKKTGKKAVRTSKATKHPKAGGGFGEGNIKNRNINQTGLLSVLGGTSPAGTSKAMAAAVTNLDAVKVPGATEKNFSVGGLKGVLGNGSIAVASGPIVQTRGSSQVLRSAGAGGNGEVAALARGTTGKKKVQAMVTAKMNRTVKIEGGMSREMVKKVIDQHLDEITYCYETALMTNPSILGRVVFEWKILKNGRVGQVRIVSSSVNSNQIHGCIKSAIQSWQFPKPVGTEVIVSYPFVFDLVSF